MRKIFILLVSLLLILIGCSEKINSDLTQKIQGQGNRLLTYTLSPEEIWVGVPVTLTLKMKGEKDDDVFFNKPETLPENLRLIEAKADDNQLKITLKADKPGEYALPPLSVMFENPRENVELLTRPMEFSVISLVEEGSENSLFRSLGCYENWFSASLAGTCYLYRSYSDRVIPFLAALLA
jgi:hypothetical protein